MFEAIMELEPDDPSMVEIRTAYFNATGHYGSDEEVKAWYAGYNTNNSNKPKEI